MAGVSLLSEGTARPACIVAVLVDHSNDGVGPHPEFNRVHPCEFACLPGGIVLVFWKPTERFYQPGLPRARRTGIIPILSPEQPAMSFQWLTCWDR